jgi:putative two-component system response regulator
MQIKALESGAVDFILKPVNTDILHHRIELHLQLAAYRRSLEHTVKELEDNIGYSFAELLEYKDAHSTGHVLRTCKYVELLCQALLEQKTFGDEFSREEADLIIRAIPFHDIGKIGVSDRVLRKQGTLTAEEYEEIKKHTVIGAQVLQRIYDRTPHQPYLTYAHILAEGHHERFDGRGYPNGLAGVAIPLCCRILTVVNVYDACRTERIYRRALNHRESLYVIIGGKGADFDPQVVDVFESIGDKFSQLSRELESV